MHRKLLHIILSVLLLATTTGFRVRMHYCLGEYQHSSLAWLDLDCCESVETPPPGCCDDTIAYFQLDDDFQAEAKFQIADVTLDFTPPNVKLSFADPVSAETKVILKTAIPPPRYAPIPILFQSFLL